MKHKLWIDKHIESLQGKTVIITGSNSGIGFECAKYCAYLGATVIMACRNESRANEAIAKILKELPEAKLRYINYDQSSFTSIDRFVDELVKTNAKVDYFIANAGIYHPKEPGLTMNTNFLGLLYLSKRFKEFVKEKGKLIFVTSLTYKHAPIRKSKVLIDEKLKPIKEYANTKYAIACLFHSFLEEGYFQAYLMHPGVSNTNIVNSSSSGFSRAFQRAASLAMPLFTHRPPKASLGMLVALSNNTKPGAYIVPRGLFEIVGFPKIKKEKLINHDIVEKVLYQGEQALKKRIDENVRN